MAQLFYFSERQVLDVGKKRSNKAWVGGAMKRSGRDYGNALRGGPKWGMSRVKRGTKRKRRKLF